MYPKREKLSNLAVAGIYCFIPVTAINKRTMLMVAIIAGGILLLFVNMLISRPRRHYTHYDFYHSVPPGYMNHEEYAYDLKLRNHTAALMNALIFVTVLLLAFIYFSDRQKETTTFPRVDSIDHTYQDNSDVAKL